MAKIGKTYSLEDSTVRTIEAIAMRKGYNQSAYVEKSMNTIINNDPASTFIEKYQANVKILSGKLESLESLQEMDQNCIRICQFIDDFENLISKNKEINEKTLKNELKNKILTLLDIIKSVKEIDQNRYAEIELHLKSCKKFFRLYKTLQDCNPLLEDYNIVVNSTSNIDKPKLTTPEHLKDKGE